MTPRAMCTNFHPPETVVEARNSLMAAPRNMKPKRMPTVLTDVMLKRSTSTPINSHAMPVIRNSHQFFANPVASLRISVSIRTPP